MCLKLLIFLPVILIPACASSSTAFHMMYSAYILCFPGGSEVKASACNAGDLGLIPGLGRSPGEGNSNPLRYSCLENPMDGGAWWATVHGVAKSQTRLSDFTYSAIISRVTMHSLDVLLSRLEPLCCSMSGSLLLLDLHTDFSGGRSGGLVLPSLEEFSTVCCDPHKGFGIVNKAAVDIFLKLLLFL